MKTKKLTKSIAILLCVVLMSGLFTPMSQAETLPGTGIDIINREVDPPTSGQMGFSNLYSVHDGRIWTDKTVRAGTGPDEFNVTLSALAQSFPLSSGYTIPADTVFIIDISGSMTGTDPGQSRSRIALLVDALNEAIGILQNANPENRIAVVAYGGTSSGGYARVEYILPLGRYEATNNNFFSYSSSNVHVNVNQSAYNRNILVAGSTPTQYGIFVGTQVLLNNPNRTIDVPVTGDGLPPNTTVNVTRRPNIILMTDGEPTMGWSDYRFADTQHAVPMPTAGGSAQFSLVTANENSGANSFFYGDGGSGEMGISMFTVLTAAYRKRLVYNHYFGTNSGWTQNPGSGQLNQPDAAVGFYTISLGPAGRPLINAMMDPFGNNPPAPSGTSNAAYATPRALNPSNYPSTAPNVSMGTLLNDFSVAGATVQVWAQRRGANYGSARHWEAVSLTNSAPSLTPDDLRFVSTVGGARGYFPATDLDTLREAFLTITSGIQQESNYPVTRAGNPDVDGWLVFSDVLGEYMEFRGVPTLTFPATFSGSSQSATAVTGTPINLTNTTQRAQFEAILLAHMNYGGPVVEVTPAMVNHLITASINAGFTNSVRYFADANRGFVGNYSANPPDYAYAVVEIFPMSGPSVPSPLDNNNSVTLMYVAFHVVTALRSGTFTEIFYGTIGATPMERTLAAGDQLIRWYIPASLIPLRNVPSDNVVNGNRAPIQVTYRVGLNRDRVTAGISSAYLSANASTAQAGSVYFYANRWRGNTNVTLAFYQPHDLNPWYHGDVIRPVLKSTNVTGTAAHSAFARVVESPPNSGILIDSHWLGNNGRLTLRLLGQLTLTKGFIYDGGPLSTANPLPEFDFVIRNSQGAVVATVPFNTDRFTWQAGINRYVLTTPLTLPVGTYTVTKAPQNVEMPGYLHLPQPGANTVVVPSSGTGVLNFLNKYFTPAVADDLPSLRVIKVFHDLPDNVYPPNFMLRVVGPEPVAGVAVHPQQDNPLPGWTLNTATNRFEITLNRAEATAGGSLVRLTPGNYEIHELNVDGVAGYQFDRVTVIYRDGQTLSPATTYNNVPSPLRTVTVAEGSDIIVRIDNFYVVAPPQTGQLMLAKGFIFDGGPLSQVDMSTLPNFDFVVRDAGGGFVARIPFDTTRFVWAGPPINRYTLSTALTLPAGTYTVEKDPQFIDIPGFAHLPQPGANRVVVPQGGTGVLNLLNKYFEPTPEDELPALRVIKIFHDLPDNVYPPNFMLRVVGPEPVAGTAVHPQQENPLPGWTLNTATNRYEITLNRAAATTVNRFVRLTPGDYEIHELNVGGITGFRFDRLTVIDREISDGHSLSPVGIYTTTVPSPLRTISVADENDIIVRVDNFYVVAPVTPPDGPPPDLTVPPPVTPQTGVDRNVILPILIIILGAGALTGAGFYLRAQKKKNEADK